MLGDRGVTRTLFATPRAGYRVPTPLPISASIRFQPTPFARSVAILFVFRIIFGQPALFPFAFAVRSPAYTRTVGSWLFAEGRHPALLKPVPSDFFPGSGRGEIQRPTSALGTAAEVTRSSSANPGHAGAV